MVCLLVPRDADSRVAHRERDVTRRTRCDAQGDAAAVGELKALASRFFSTCSPSGVGAQRRRQRGIDVDREGEALVLRHLPESALELFAQVGEWGRRDVERR